MSDQKKESVREQLFGWKSNLRGLARLAAVVFTLIAVIWVTVRFTRGEKAADATTAALLRRPMELKNSIENLKASSIAGLPITLPYDGTLSIEVNVVNGNKIDVYLIPTTEYEHIRKNESFSYIRPFEATKTKAFKQEQRLNSGTYYIVLRDQTLGILSASTSDIKVIAKLEP